MAGTDVVARLVDLPADAQSLFDTSTDYGTSRTWFAVTEATALQPNEGASYVVVEGEALFPMVRSEGMLRSMTTPYTWRYEPLGSRLTAGAAEAFGRFCRAHKVVVIDGLDADWPGLPVMIAGFHRAGLVVSRFDHFGNWHEPIDGRDWATYLATRPGKLRELLRRHMRDAGASLRYEMIRTPTEVERGIDLYEYVYAKSWKSPEPFPRFGPALLRAAAADGALRLTLLWRDEVVLAAQYWVVWRGSACVLKLAHDESARAISPGSLLTAWSIRQLIEVDGVEQLDFGRGDDAYKRLWASQRHGRVGLVAAWPWHPVGAVAILRQALGSLRRRFRACISVEANRR